MKLRIIMFLIMIILLNSALSSETVRIKHIEGEDVTGTIQKIDSEKIYVTQNNSKVPQSLDLRNLEEIEFISKSDNSTEDIFAREIEIYLISGDVFFGRIIRVTDDEEGFVFETQSFGKIPIKLDWIQKMVNADNADNKINIDPNIKKKKSDAIYFKPTDTSEDSDGEVDILIGSVNAITVEGVDFSDNFGYYKDHVFKWSNVLAVTFEQVEKIEIPKIFQVIISCRNGEKFLGELIKNSESGETYNFRSTVLKTDEIGGIDEEIWQPHLSGLIVAISTTKLQKLTFRYGNFAYLSDIEPTETDEFPFFGGRNSVDDKSKYWWRYKLDKSVAGGDLFLIDKNGRRNRMTKGIGVHSFSKLTFDLDGTYKIFKSDIGIEADAGNLSSVIFRVFCDDEKKPRYESPIFRKSTGFIGIAVDITNVKRLHLEVDFADNGDIQDRAIWGRARIFKENVVENKNKETESTEKESAEPK